MAILIWVMVGLALWHFTVFLPDKFWAGIVGAFLGALVGSVVIGVLLSFIIRGGLPGEDDTSLLTGLEGIPGAVIGMAIVWWIGVRQLEAQGQQAVHY
ncbi:MAG TPA: hypothetical protein VFZ00_32195 [Solirubrobacter sp.]|jgi:hypothetical protein|nr:hypothetical protein [Solirubrobacter sp.]